MHHISESIKNMEKVFLSCLILFSVLKAFGQGDFVLEKKTGKYIYQEDYSQYDRKLIVDFARNQTTGKWLIKKTGKWGLFSSKLGMVIRPEYDTIVILAGNSYGILKNNKWALYDSHGDMGDFKFEKLVSNSNEGLYVKMNEEWGNYKNGAFTPNYMFMSPDEPPTVIDLEDPDAISNDKTLFNIIMQYLKYPTIAKENGIAGKVIAKVFITENGDLDHVEIHTTVHESLDNEVLRLINEHMYMWNPGKMSGQAIPCTHILPFNFRLDN
jgi:hypothetical protein